MENEKELFCFDCHKIFKTAATLKNHQKLHVDLGPFSCDTCGKFVPKSFKNKA